MVRKVTKLHHLCNSAFPEAPQFANTSIFYRVMQHIPRKFSKRPEQEAHRLNQCSPATNAKNTDAESWLYRKPASKGLTRSSWRACSLIMRRTRKPFATPQHRHFSHALDL
jgi:hypothetical protein